MTQIVPSSFKTKTVSDTLTRPANTTTYTANDVVSDTTSDAHYSFALSKGIKSQSGVIVSARITSSAFVATAPDLELWLFRNDVTDAADNIAATFTDAEMLTRVGVIDFATANWKAGLPTAGAGGNHACEVYNLGIHYNLVDANMYGQLVVRNGYVPVSGEIFTVELVVTQD
mgnify:CR=1 FL=1